MLDECSEIFTDDLPVIKENIRKTFLETQSKVNKWVSDFKKKIDGEDVDEGDEAPNLGNRQGPAQQGYGNRRSGELGRRSGERDRYDADPQVLGDDFASLELRDEEGLDALYKHYCDEALTIQTPAPPPRPPRPLANPDLFKPTPSTPSAGTRKVSFQLGAPTEIGVSSYSQPERKPSPVGKSSKWEPLQAVDPNPVADNDPFSLGDSDDERETKTKDVRAEDTERLRTAAADAMATDIGPTSKQGGLEEHPKTGPQGTKDKEAEELLTGGKS